MAGKKTGKRLLTWVLVLVMALSLLPLNVLAEELGGEETPETSTESSTEDRGAHLVKSATKVGDTYKIQLESWVTGKVEQTTGSAPLDIVLVLDQSGSMAENNKLDKLKNAVRNFVDTVKKDAADNEVEHRIAIVGFASNRTEGGSNSEDGAWYNTGIFVNGKLKNYETYEGDWTNVYLTSDSKPDDDYEYSAYLKSYSIFRTGIEYNAEKQEWGYWSGFWGDKWNTITPKTVANDDNSDHIQVQRRAKAGYIGLTAADYQDALVKSSETSFSTAIDNLSASGATRASYGMEMANNVFANNSSEERSRVVVFFTDGEPGKSGYETSEAGRAIAQAHATKNTYGAKVFSVGMFDNPSTHVGKFMDYVSSNYPNANASSNWLGNWTITHGNKDADKFYMTVENDNLSDVFQTISGSILKPGVTANADTVLTDTLSQYFDFDGVTVENGTVTGVTVKKVAYAGNDAWATDGEDITSVVTVHLNGKAVEVSGFDYSDEKNVVTDRTTPSGYKLVVTFNVKPDISYTNWDASGEYATNKGNATVTHPNIEEPIAIAASPEVYVKTYQVTYGFDTTAPDGATHPEDNQYYISGQTADVKPPEPSSIELDGHTYTFNGWKNGEADVGEKIDISGDVTLTGSWSKTPNTASYTVNYLWNGTSIKDSTTDTAACGSTVNVTAPNIDGYTLIPDQEMSIEIGAGENVLNLNYYKNVTLTANSKTVKYDGQSHDGSPYSCDALGLLPGHRVDVDYTCEPQTNVGEYDIELDNAKIVDADGNDVTDLYQITYNYGKLTITEASAPTPGTFDFNDVDYSDDKNTPAITKTVKGNVGRNFKETFKVTVKGTDAKSKDTMSAPDYTGKAEVIASKSLKDVPFLFKPEVMANAVVPYGELRFTEAGTYTYTVREVPGGTSRMSYDTTEYTLKINVVLDEDSNTYQVKSWQFTPGNRKNLTQLNIVNTYRTYHPSASSTSKPTLNTGDHYAYVMGYPDGTVRPNGSITRAEVSAILFRLLSDKTRDEYFTTESSFTDVKAGAWYNNSIATLEKAGVIVDTAKGGAFRPNEAITRAELAAMLAQFSDAKPVKGVKFSDVSAEHWAYEAIAIAAKMGWIEGYPDGTFRPDATITRAEMMTLVNRALDRVPSDEDHLLSKRVMLTFPDCKSGDWFYIAVQEATNSHTYERAATEKNGDEQWTALRANRDWTLLEK